ncbi:DNA phosphorothioation-dependent restriction protein DptH [Vibrio panuliri]|uniref:DNA phosphorothioation-dependent restriction protein DptH n=1 Tax=Vibrio panuliri TaxID=1381081 RepID=A0ABX3FFX6_9VIBR|nr:DNA phosphorothioation-dependent restriction protein DptH [Vibrio panuliri]KAB1454814.1 DNA phosphorothioation-dependent restriction protein DptH [Vibrio panuliri]OLQ89903.1 DNA phosphorothioation-dependent restriction protein DptH [Vibrio panuliri]
MYVKPFEDFLVELFVSDLDFEKAGERYHFKSPDSANSTRLYKSFMNLSKREINAAIGDELISLPVVNCGKINLIPVLHRDEKSLGTKTAESTTKHGFTENFISTLRDAVSGQNAQFKGSVLLVIHNSSLDTIISACDDVAKENSVWHPEKIKDALYDMIGIASKLRKVSECLLEQRYKQVNEDESTMFGFEGLHKVVQDGDLKFSELNLLDDPKILDWQDNPKQIEERLEQNRKLYDRIDRITKNENDPNELKEKLAEIDFGDKFISEHFGGDDAFGWKQSLTLGECFQEQQKNKQNLLELEPEILDRGELIAKSKSDTKAGQRERHLILLLEDEQQTFNLELSFLNGRVEKKQCSIQHDYNGAVEVTDINNTGGKRSRVLLEGTYTDSPVFFTLSLKRDKTAERFKFKVLAIRARDFHVDAFRTNFLIQPATTAKKTPQVVLQTGDKALEIAEQGSKVSLEKIGQEFDRGEVGTVDFQKIANESDELRFTVNNGEASLTFNIEGPDATDSLRLPLMLDQERHGKLFTRDDYFGLFRANSKVVLDNKENSPVGRRLTLLQWEAQQVAQRLLSGEIVDENPEGEQLSIADLEVSYPNLHIAYRELFDYCVDNRTLISLAGWGPKFRDLVKKVVQHYYEALDTIENDVVLNDQQKQLIKIGFITAEGREYISPFSPLVLAHSLELAQNIEADRSGSFKELPPVTVARLNARGLLPYLYDARNGFAFSQEDKDNSFWIALMPQQETSYAFVRRLVKDKVSEFKEAFSSLFSVGSQSTLIINSVNNHKNRELFLGLVDYVKGQKDKVCHIHVNLYDDKLLYSEFDRFAETGSHEELKARYEIDKGGTKAREQADMVVDLLRTRITYSKFENDKVDGEQAYAHLSFFLNNSKVEARDVNVEKQLSGVLCHGLMAGEASESEEGSYNTAFGLRGVDCANKPHLQIAQKLNSLIKPARRSGEKTSNAKSMSLMVSDNFKTLLDRSYENSIWTTIIDPKVTLDFFDASNDAVLIQYSDNYTNSTNYDAITVTKQTEVYKKVLEQGEGGIIEEFNAFNGEWLLKMVAATGNPTAIANNRKEKRGIIGAYKFVNCLLAQSDIIWVPMSVAEMLRVAGNIGLKMSDGDFSRKSQGYQSGAISDDVLFVGFKDQQMYLLPLEVKAGQKQTHSKGVKQALELKRYLSEDILGRDDLAGNLYRGLFIRQVLMQVDKYQLYDLYEDNYFDAFLNQREWWLQGDYGLADIAEYPKGFLVSLVENDTFICESFEEVDDILKIELPVSDVTKFIATPLQMLINDIRPEKLCAIPEQYILKGQTSGVTSISMSTKPESDTAHAKYEPDLDTGVDAVAPTTPATAEPKLLVDDQRLVKNGTESLKVLIGHDVRNQEPMLWEPTNTAKFMNTNTGIIGTMGTGKTQFTKSVITQLYRNQADNVNSASIGMLIFDYKSDYVDDKFQQATAGKKFNLHKLPYNPLSLFGDTPMLPVHTARGFSETMGKAFGLGQKQQLRLRKLVGEAYELAGIRKADPSTWTKPAPTISQVWDLFIETDPDEDSLYAALESLYELEIFEDDNTKCMSLYDLVDGITVIELAGYPSEIQNLVVALTLDLFYSQMQKKGKPEVQGDFRQITKMILVDEADNFMSQNFPSLRKILKEGREYGVGVILSTQDITHFQTGENDYSSYVLTWVVHRVAKIRPQELKAMFGVNEKAEQEKLMETINKLEKHYSLYIDGAKKIVKMRDRAFWELM